MIIVSFGLYISLLDLIFNIEIAKTCLPMVQLTISLIANSDNFDF